MRKFSSKEQQLIQNIIKEDGFSLDKIFFDEFKNNGKIEVNLDTARLRVFTSKNLEYKQFIREFNLVINLIDFLQKEGLMYHYSIATVLPTSISTFGSCIEGEKVSIFIPSNEQYLLEFIKKHNGVTFEANETLKILSANGFKTDDEIRYEETNEISIQNLFLSKRNIYVAISIAIVSSLVQLGIAIYQNRKEAESLKAVNSLEIHVHKLTKRVKANSAEVLKLKERNQVLENHVKQLTQEKVDEKVK